MVIVASAELYLVPDSNNINKRADTLPGPTLPQFRRTPVISRRVNCAASLHCPMHVGCSGRLSHPSCGVQYMDESINIYMDKIRFNEGQMATGAQGHRGRRASVSGHA